METLERRIKRLERLAFGLAVALVVAVATAAVQAGKDASFNIVHAKHIAVVDEKGVPRINLGVEAKTGSAYVSMPNQKEKMGILIQVTGSGKPKVVVSDQESEARLQVGLAGPGDMVMLVMDKDGKQILVIPK